MRFAVPPADVGYADVVGGRVHAAAVAAVQRILRRATDSKAPSYTFPGWMRDNVVEAEQVQALLPTPQQWSDVVAELGAEPCRAWDVSGSDEFVGVLTAAPGDVDNLAALQLFADGDAAGSVRLLDAVIDLSSSTTAAVATSLYNRGVMQLDQRDVSGALASLEACVALDATARPWFSLGVAYERAGLPDAAARAYQAAVSAAKEGEPQFAARAYSRLVSLEGRRVAVVLVEVATPFWMVVADPRRDALMGAALWDRRVWDPAATDIFGAVLRRACAADATQRGLVVDVGANFGYFSLLAARLGCSVVAVEPLPPLAAVLRRNVALNRVGDRVHVVQAAVSHTASSVHMRLYEFGCVGCSHTTATTAAGGPAVDGDHTADERHPTFRVPAVTLDATVAARRPALVKLDVEGCEASALLSFARAFAQGARPHFVVEVCPQVWSRCGTRMADGVAAFGMLLDAGYSAMAFEVTAAARAVLPEGALDAAAAAAAETGGVRTPMHRVRLRTRADIHAFFEGQGGVFGACTQLWWRPPE